MILWTCPQKCGHYPNTNFICKLQSCIHIKILTLAAFYGILFNVMARKMRKDDACTDTCISEHISSCSIAHTSTNHQSTNMCCWYIYMTAVNVHWSSLKKTGVLKLLQDKNQLLIKTQTLVIVPTYSLTNPQKILKYSVFS